MIKWIDSNLPENQKELINDYDKYIESNPSAIFMDDYLMMSFGKLDFPELFDILFNFDTENIQIGLYYSWIFKGNACFKFQKEVDYNLSRFNMDIPNIYNPDKFQKFGNDIYIQCAKKGNQIVALLLYNIVSKEYVNKEVDGTYSIFL